MTLWANKSITVARVRLAQANKVLKIVFGTLVSSKGFETSGHAAFSSTLWGKQTKDFLLSVNAIPADEMDEIIQAASAYVKKGRNGANKESADENDPRSCIMNGAASESEHDDEVVITGWGRVVDLGSSSPPPEVPPPAVKQSKVSATSKVTKSTRPVKLIITLSPPASLTNSTTMTAITSDSAQHSRPMKKPVPKQFMKPSTSSGNKGSTSKKATKNN